jgi:hypothetical protein
MHRQATTKASRQTEAVPSDKAITVRCPEAAPDLMPQAAHVLLRLLRTMADSDRADDERRPAA